MINEINKVSLRSNLQIVANRNLQVCKACDYSNPSF